MMTSLHRLKVGAGTTILLLGPSTVTNAVDRVLAVLLARTILLVENARFVLFTQVDNVLCRVG